MRRRSARLFAALCLVLPAACSAVDFSRPGPLAEPAAYTALHPYYAEFCALSQILKRSGFGAEIRGEIGGHSVFYLNGACRDEAANYPVLRPCDVTGDPGRDGVGISVNAHFRNANWVATEGRDFFLHGDLAPGEALTAASYARSQARARALGIYDGVAFHRAVFDDKPAGMSERDFMYEISVATDYAVGFGRDRYCARVPLDRARMARVVDYLNAENAPYRAGRKEFEWNVLRNNCAHLAHNVLAAVGVWPEWPTERFFLVAAFDFPVPKNEFVNLVWRTNEMPLSDPEALFDDPEARAAVLGGGALATAPGGLAQAERVVQQNDVYRTDLRLIFYDEPIFGHYQERFDAIFAEPRYTDLRANLEHFAQVYAGILTARRPADEFRAAHGREAAEFTAFQRRYYEYVAAERSRVEQQLAGLPAATILR